MILTDNTSSAEKSSVDLSQRTVRHQLAKLIKQGIDDYCVKTYSDGHRSHLGGSRIGGACSRALWYEFRWARQEQLDGRKLRLFNTGHRAEERFLEWLRGMGCAITDYVVNEDGESKQLRIVAVDGHFGGSLDGQGVLPEAFRVAEEFIFEFKTHNTASFSKLANDGVAATKPVHFAQMSQYGLARGIKYAIYVASNKNDDDIYVEVIELNWKLAEDNLRKADYIVHAEIAPTRISESPTAFACKWCHFAPICHSGELPERNCRTCRFSVPIENAQWGCRHWSEVIPKDFMSKGCDKYERLF